MPTPETCALDLIQAYRQRTRLDVDATSGPNSTEMAYRVQKRVWQGLVGASRPSAWKVGSSALEETPTAAPVFPTRLARSPADFPRELFGCVGVEAEIAVVFGEDLALRDAAYSHTEIVAAIGSVHVAMELVDSRLANPPAAGPLWRLADNLLNGALVLGDEIAQWQERVWDRLKVQIQIDGQTLTGVSGRPPLGDIFHCLPWWLAHVGGAKAGDIVTTGAWSGMHPVDLATQVAVSFVGLGQAKVDFTRL